MTHPLSGLERAAVTHVMAWGPFKMPAVAYAPTISPAFSFVFRLLIWNEIMDAASPSLVICNDNWKGLSNRKKPPISRHRA